MTPKQEREGLFTNARQGEVAAAGAPLGQSSGAGAKPEQPVCEQAVFLRYQAAKAKEWPLAARKRTRSFFSMRRLRSKGFKLA